MVNTNLQYANEMLIFLIACCLIAWFTSQLFKAILNCCISKNYTFKYFIHCFFADGDFPSSHTCFSVTSLIVMIPYVEEIIHLGNTSLAEITICRLIEVHWILFVFVIVKDAIGVRGSLKKLSSVVKTFLSKPEIFLNEVTNELQSFWTGISEGININVGHMPHEVIGGMILAIIIGLGANSIRLKIYPLLVVDIILAVLYFASTFYILTHKEKIVKLYKKIRLKFRKKD